MTMAGSRSKSSGTKSKASSAGPAKARKPAAKRKPASKPRAAPRKNPTKQVGGHSFGRDLMILASAGLAVFMGFAVYYPSFSDPAGPWVNANLHISIGIGMYVIPVVMACVPFMFFENKWRPRFLGAWLWSWALTILGALIGGCFTAQDWGGLLGESAYTLGHSKLGDYYQVLVGIVSLLVIVRIVGWRPFVSMARGGVQAGAIAVEAASSFKQQINEEAAILKEQRDERRARQLEQTQQARARRSERDEALIAAELEVAAAPDNDSPIIREKVAADSTSEGAPAGETEAETPGSRTQQPVQPVDLSNEAVPGVRPLHSTAVLVDPQAVTGEAAVDEFIDVVNAAGAAGLAVGAFQAPVLISSVDPADPALQDNTDVSLSPAESHTDTEPGTNPAQPDKLEKISAALDRYKPAGLDDAAATAETEIARDDSDERLRALAQSQGKTIEEQQMLFPGSESSYQLPGVELLKDAVRSAGEEEYLAPRAAIIEKTLASFNLEARCVNWVVGPRVTRFEIKIGPGINVNKFSNLADNLALELAVKAVRIEAPIPGMSAVGIEVPNASPELVTLKDILTSSIFRNNNHPLTVAIGRDIAGNPIVANLAKMPHLLVAGATGSGKSVCLNTLIVSLLMRNTPETLRLILIDPKRVEMTSYEDVPVLACPVVCDVTQVQSALKWVVAEMDRRYRLLQIHKARNIATFNDQVEPRQRLPFLVVVIDELADLMMLAGQTIEKLICRITQLSRAVGIHLVIATQRPDVKVITGLIKANVPSRIAFAVVSNVDSRTILDGGGAEKLLGSGDMLFSPIGENVPIRVQGCYLADDEINRVTEWCRSQADTRYDQDIMSFGQEDEEGAGSTGSTSDGDDPLLQEAEQIVRSTGRASTSFLQRKLKIGYNRAARIMEELEFAEVVSPPDHAGNRKVLL
jgi:S-DNA-T family DNA segregation ATPase FtsK/SpoIIIE